MKFTIMDDNGQEWQAPEPTNEYRIEYFYDRHQRYWFMEICDTGTDDQMESKSGLSKAALLANIEYYKTQYNVVEVVKR